MNRVITPGTQIKFNCGDVVAREDDPRHEGVVIAVIGNDARVAWPDLNNAREDVNQDELVLISRKRRSGGGAIRPATITESPRAQLERWMAERDEDTNGELK
jgi:hypothetical protein